MQVARTNEVSATGLTRRRLGQSALTYATSAAANAAAAGLYASAVGLQRSGDSLTGLVNIAGTLVLYVGLLAGLAAAILFIAAMEELRLRWPWIDPASRRAFSIFWTLSLLGLVALGLLGAMYAGSAVAFTFERAQFIVVAFQGVCAVAAAIFAVALASLPFMLSAGSSRRLAIVAVLLAGVGIAGEMAIGISNSALYSPTSSSLLMFGGFPLVNLNLPFGALVAFSAALLWLAYRQLPSALDNGLAQSSAMISGPGAAQARPLEQLMTTVLRGLQVGLGWMRPPFACPRRLVAGRCHSPASLYMTLLPFCARAPLALRSMRRLES